MLLRVWNRRKSINEDRLSSASIVLRGMIGVSLFFVSIHYWIIDIFCQLERLRWLDELLIVIVILVAYFVLLIKPMVPRKLIPLILPLACFIIIGLLSGLLNQRPMLVTLLGIFDYVKYFVFLAALSLLAVSRATVEWIYSCGVAFAFVFTSIAIVQETVWALGFDPQIVGVSFVDIRGVMRTPSILGHPNLFGLYVALFFMLHIFVSRRLGWQGVFLLTGIVLAGSRMVWTSIIFSLLLFGLAEFSRRRTRSHSIFAFMIVVSVALIGGQWFVAYTASEFSGEGTYRGYALRKSVEIWRDHAIVGTGPGSYGGVISFTFGSPIYDAYGFDLKWKQFGEKFRSLDQFWPQCLVEVGLMGTLTMAFLFVALFLLGKQQWARFSADLFYGGLFRGLCAATLVLVFYLMGSGLNMTPFLFSYSLLFGTALGSLKWFGRRGI